MKGIKDNLNTWRNILRSWTRRLNIVEVLIFPKFIHRLKAIPFKISAREFFIDIDKIILKYLWKGKGTKITKTNF